MNQRRSFGDLDGKMSRRAALGAFGSTAMVMAAPNLGHAQAPANRPPNILFILADDMGYADLGCYGSRHISTPNLDQLAREGVQLTDAYANSPVCSPTRLSLATGRYNRAFRTGLVEPFRPGDWGEAAIPAGYPTYMTLLQQAGYRTSLVGKWHLGPTPSGHPLNYGFSHFYGFLGGTIDYFTHESSGKPALMEERSPIEQKGYMTDLLTDEAIRCMQESAANGQPFAINLHYNAPHFPWKGPNDVGLPSERSHHDGGSLDIYASMVENMDGNIGRVLAELARLGLAQDTLVVFTSDNGGERFSEVWPFRGNKGTLLEGGTRVPAIMRYPRRLPAGTRSAGLAITMDFYPTFLELAGIALPDADLHGVPLLPLLAAGSTTDRALFWGFQGHRQAAARRGRWKYFAIEGQEFLYDLESDPHERANRKIAERAIFADLKAEWAAWNERMYPSDGITGYCAKPEDQALELPTGDGSNCTIFSAN